LPYNIRKVDELEFGTIERAAGYGGGVMEASDHVMDISLEERLWNARIEWPVGGNQYFIPVDDLQRLLTTDSVIRELLRYQPGYLAGDLEDIAEKISRKCIRLFAILVCMDMGMYASSFLQEGLDDKDLPFVRSEIETERPGTGHFELRSKIHPDCPIRCMSKWSKRQIATFSHEQWSVLAPIFKWEPNIRHYELDDNCVLPFIEDQERTGKTGEGGYGSVWGVRIHPAHQQLLDPSTNHQVSLHMARTH
jgi:hypothetical protein